MIIYTSQDLAIGLEPEDQGGEKMQNLDCADNVYIIVCRELLRKVNCLPPQPRKTRVSQNRTFKLINVHNHIALRSETFDIVTPKPLAVTSTKVSPSA